MTDRPLPSSFDDNELYNEKPLQKVVRRLKEEPLVPIGCILTVVAFTNAYRAMRRGNHEQVQRMFRARVAAQAFTVIAMVGGGMYYSADRHKAKEMWKLKEEQEAEEKRQKWIKELEVRDEEDKALKERLDKRRKRAAERAAAGGGPEGIAAQAKGAFSEGAGDNGDAPGAGEATVDSNKTNKSVLGSIGGMFRKSSPGEAKDSGKDESAQGGR
ncbi:hypoxia induced protein conserved region-domain-containing protein [Podospora conica]|nr:hypoxia induced protein conserved region-domain-containing protein [Schizothecium conicum]